MWLLTLILLIFILGIIILVHEFGHFITAKKSGVHIYEFSKTILITIQSHRKENEWSYSVHNDKHKKAHHRNF